MRDLRVPKGLWKVVGNHSKMNSRYADSFTLSPTVHRRSLQLKLKNIQRKIAKVEGEFAEGEGGSHRTNTNDRATT